MTLLLKRRDATGDDVRFLEKLRDRLRRPRIRCPSCGWQPGPTSQWGCVPTGAPEHFSDGCGTAWNTFETGGRCPGCSYQWQYTACLQCQSWARHEEWYVVEDE